jgi:hypothetical protein
MSEKIVKSILQTIHQINIEKLKTKNTISTDAEQSEAIKNELDALRLLMESNTLSKEFKEFYQAYYDLISTDPVNYMNCYPLNKNRLQSRLADNLIDALHDTISPLYSRATGTHKDLETELEKLTVYDWILMTLSKADNPFIHEVFRCSLCRPENMAIFVKYVPMDVLLCPWYVDKTGMTCIQYMTFVIHTLKNKKMDQKIKQSHTIVKNVYSKALRFLKTVDVYGYASQEHMFNSVPWYLSLKMAPEPNHEYFVEIEFNTKVNTQESTELSKGIEKQ